MTSSPHTPAAAAGETEIHRGPKHRVLRVVDPEILLGRADELLYRAKAQGRNRTLTARDDPTTPND